MPPTESYRELVTARAGGVCEYCRLVEAACGVTFHIDHIVPRTEGGATAMSNLALCCPGCNLSKAGKTAGLSQDGTDFPLYNPRDFEPWLLGWHLHFSLGPHTGLIHPVTLTGEVTVATLKMNGAARVFARKLQVQAGLIA